MFLFYCPLHFCMYMFFPLFYPKTFHLCIDLWPGTPFSLSSLVQCCFVPDRCVPELKSLGCSVPWMMRPLDDASLGCRAPCWSQQIPRYGPGSGHIGQGRVVQVSIVEVTHCPRNGTYETFYPGTHRSGTLYYVILNGCSWRGTLLTLQKRHFGQLAYNFVIWTANIFLLNSSFFRWLSL